MASRPTSRPIHLSFRPKGYVWPRQGKDEVEIARIEINSTTSYGASVYARRGKSAIHYRVVDQYTGETLTGPGACDSPEPLSLGELENFLLGAWPLMEVLKSNCEGDVEQMLGLVDATSESYPDLDQLLRKRVIDAYPTEAIAWYRTKAGRGDADGQYFLGQSYVTGQGVPQDFTQAMTWLRKAADQGDADGQSNVGWLYAEGRGVPQDDAQAATWFRKAADQGLANAQCNLGVLYENGQGVTQDFKQATGWFRKAADQGHADAQFRLGQSYAIGRGVPQDIKQAAEWYERSAYQGHPTAQFNLAVLYTDGQGVRKDMAQAVKWYRLAADQDHPDAQANLGLLYATGQGVPQDLTKAIPLFLKAAQQGFAYAQSNLASLYATGQGLPQDLVEAYKWYSLAVINAPDEVQDSFAERRDSLEEELTVAQLTEAKKRAADWQAAFEKNRSRGPEGVT